MERALVLLNSLIDCIDPGDEASNTLGGNASYFHKKFSAETETNPVLLEALNLYPNINGDKILEKELETKYSFAFFIRHYRNKARHIKQDPTNLKGYTLKHVEMVRTLVEMQLELRKHVKLKASRVEQRFLLEHVQLALSHVFMENQHVRPQLLIL